jgi:hypothetical protein
MRFEAVNFKNIKMADEVPGGGTHPSTAGGTPAATTTSRRRQQFNIATAAITLTAQQSTNKFNA